MVKNVRFPKRPEETIAVIIQLAKFENVAGKSDNLDSERRRRNALCGFSFTSVNNRSLLEILLRFSSVFRVF